MALPTGSEPKAGAQAGSRALVARRSRHTEQGGRCATGCTMLGGLALGIVDCAGAGAEGRAMPLEQAMAYALEEDADSGSAEAGAG